MSVALDFPRVEVQWDGRPIMEEDAGALEEVRVQRGLSLPAQCELTFFNPKGALANLAPSVIGSPLQVEVQGQAQQLFVGEVTAVEYVHPPSGGLQVRVRGYDSLHRLRKRQHVRAHVQVTVLDLARELVQDLGLSVEAAEPGPVWQRLIQHHQSDLQLLQELAQRCGLFLTLRGNVLHLVTLEGLGETIPLRLGEALLEARMEVNGDSSCRSVHASGWDPWRVERHEGQASAPRVGRQVNIEEMMGGTGQRTLTNQTAQNDLQAAVLAQAQLDAGVAREVTLWGVAQGDTRLLPGTRVEIEGVAEPFAGRYILTSVIHTVERAKGFVSEISSVPPRPPERARAASVAWGVVTRVDDPEHLGRIRVSLPTHGDVETEWISVLATAAGSKGLVALPDVGDHVLLLFQGEDPGQALVIGGLYGAKAPADWGIESGSVQRYSFLTPAGQKLGLDDSRRLVRLENSDGSYVELSPDKVRLHSQVDLEIEAPGRSVVVRGKTVDFQKA
ncbi:MAG TPA: phage baseplate assembly protein V [Terriglobia bacterium]|nr:phage baseplate assembly protein V [Terriglobia bacterium]